ncbi:MAG: HAD family hydrolase [Treponema sp.]|nr:HAD family hydrolase [Treponema sp.]
MKFLANVSSITPFKAPKASASLKAIFFDIDGTLIDRRGGPYSEDVAAMQKAVSLGHLLFINTGRSFANIPACILDLPVWKGIAAGGGAHVLLRSPEEPGGGNTGYRTIYHKWVPQKPLKKICSWYLENNRQLVLEGEKECYLICPSPRSFSIRTPIIIKDMDGINNIFADDYITKLTVNGSVTKAEFEILWNFFKVNAFSDYAEAIIKGESKAKGIKIILKAAGIKRKNSIALGDSANDLDMIRYAGLGVAMGNASSLLKAAADAVTAACGEGGAARMLEKYVL